MSYYHAAICCFCLVLVGCGEPPTRTLVKPSSLSLSAISNTGVVSEPEPLQHQRKLPNSIVIGLDADMSSGAAQGGESIRRGALLAIEEINRSGGLLGRPLELLVRDHRGNPERGIDNITEFCKLPDVLAILGGVHTPVVLRELETIHQQQMLLLVPWAAGTPIVANEYSPNYVFRVSVRDEYAGDFLVAAAQNRGFRKLGLLLERTGWGRSNEQALQAAIQARGLGRAETVWFNWGDEDFHRHLDLLARKKVSAIVFVGNPMEGKHLVASMAAMPDASRLPILSHWGITGGDFFRMTAPQLAKIDLSFLQTHSFLAPAFPERSRRLYQAYAQRFPGCRSEGDLFSPVGTAHAYELMMMLATAVRQAGCLDRDKVHHALEQLESYEGMIRNYARPFRPNHHDALTAEDFCMARYATDGSIQPIED